MQKLSSTNNSNLKGRRKSVTFSKGKYYLIENIFTLRTIKTDIHISGFSITVRSCLNQIQLTWINQMELSQILYRWIGNNYFCRTYFLGRRDPATIVFTASNFITISKWWWRWDATEVSEMGTAPVWSLACVLLGTRDVLRQSKKFPGATAWWDFDGKIAEVAELLQTAASQELQCSASAVLGYGPWFCTSNLILLSPLKHSSWGKIHLNISLPQQRDYSVALYPPI